MPAEQFERAQLVVDTFREQLSPEAREALGEKSFANLCVMVQQALQRERAEVAGQFEALAKALRATAAPIDLGM